MPKAKKRSTLIIEFIECLRIPEGSKVGEPFSLEPFQKKFIRDVYDNPNGTRRGYLSISRKNGKSALLAALLLVHIVGPEARLNSQVVSGARSRDQAALVWSLAAKIISLCPDLQGATHIIPSSKKIIGLPMNVEFRALSADGAKNMGISPVFAVLDEVGVVTGPTDYFTDSVTSSQGAHTDPLLIAISTQAPTDADLWSIWLDDARRSDDPHTVCHVYEADKECSLLDKRQWKKANPALGRFLNEKFLASEMDKANRLRSEENKARNLYLNQRISLHSLWMAPATWKANNAAPDWSVFQERGAVVGLDLAQKNDLCVACICAMDADGMVHAYPYAFTPLEGIEERSKRDRVPYDQWARDGVLRAVPGQTIDYDFVAQFLLTNLIENGIRIHSIEYDRWRINEFKAACQRVELVGVKFNEVGQGFQSMSPRIDALETALLQSKVCHGAHPVFNLGAASAITVQDPAGNKKLDKNKSSQKIDAIIALVMAAYPLLARQKQLDAPIAVLI